MAQASLPSSFLLSAEAACRPQAGVARKGGVWAATACLGERGRDRTRQEGNYGRQDLGCFDAVHGIDPREPRAVCGRGGRAGELVAHAAVHEP